MDRHRIILLLGVGLLAACGLVAMGAAEADFTPSTFNPAVGEIVNFAVCEPCLGGGAFTYLWDFDGDGMQDLETVDAVVARSFPEAGFYRVSLTIRGAGGREERRSKGVLVGPIPAYAIREVLPQGDDTVFVLITVVVQEASVAIALEEAIPRGWQVEVLDAGGALTRNDPEARREEVVWMSSFEAGDELTFSYRLHPSYGTAIGQFSGELSGYRGGERFSGEICGEQSLP